MYTHQAPDGADAPAPLLACPGGQGHRWRGVRRRMAVSCTRQTAIEDAQRQLGSPLASPRPVGVISVPFRS